MKNEVKSSSMRESAKSREQCKNDKGLKKLWAEVTDRLILWQRYIILDLTSSPDAVSDVFCHADICQCENQKDF